MRLIRTLRERLGPMLPLAAGLALVGIAGIAFPMAVGQVFSAATGPDATAKLALNSYYFLVTTVLMGVYNGLDQVTNRRVAHTLATAGPLGPALARAIRDAAALTAVVAVALLAASPVLVPKTLHGALGLLVAVVVGAVFAAVASVVRGVLAGAQRFGAYGTVWAAEGLSRLVLTAGLLAVGEKSTWAYGYAFVIPYLVSAAVGLFFTRDLRASIQPAKAAEQRERQQGTEATASMGLAALASAGLLTTAVANLPQLVLTSRVSSTAVEVVAYGHAFILARIALTLLTPYQSLLLPAYTHEAALHRYNALRARVRQAIVICAGVGAAWAVLVAASGHLLLRLGYADTAATIPSLLTFVLLGGGTALFAVTNAVQPALVALGRYRVVPTVWALGAAATAAASALPGFSPINAATTAAVAGPAVVVLGLAVALRQALPTPDGDKALASIPTRQPVKR